MNLKDGKIILKSDLHLHTKEDPQDSSKVKYSSYELIDDLDRKGFDVFSITLHNFIFEEKMMHEVRDYAKHKGMIFIPGIEKMIEGNHILIYNMDKARAESIDTYDALVDAYRQYGIEDMRKRDSILIVPSHPHFPSKVAIGDRLFNKRRLFHGLEYNSFYTKYDVLNFNKKTVEEAESWRKTLLGNTDAHKLAQIGNTYTQISVPASIFMTTGSKDQEEIRNTISDSSDEEYERFNRYIIHYIKKGHTSVKTRPLTLDYVLSTLIELF